VSVTTEQLNILVIDDDEDMRSLLVDIIGRGGHQVVPVSSAEEGLELLPFWTFQVAFIDHRLPGMDGLVLGEYLRRNNPDMTVALVTGEYDLKLERQTRALSITFIPKPFQVSDISGAIEAYVSAAAEREQRRIRHEDPDFDPPISQYASELTKSYAVPSVSTRVEERIVDTLKRCMNDLRSVGRYTERDRVILLAGLLTAKVLGITLPKLASGRTPFEEYDALMRQHGRRTAFDEN
jgi:CheY-like chemotaxis protein